MVDMLSFDSDDDRYIAELAEYVAIPSVSRDADVETMRAAARWLTEKLSFANARVVETSGHPVVIGEWLDAGDAPTVLVYGHYDVQPTGDLAEWITPPFELANDGARLRGRGVTDDKGPVYMVLEVVRQFMAQEGRLPLNVRFLLEGEEEIGSPHLPEYVRAHAGELAADLVISADGAMWRPSEPSLSIASKGLLALDIEVTVANPIHALVQILDTLHDADGRIAVDGFDDGVPPLSDEERAEIGAVVFDEAEYRTELGVDEVHGQPGLSTLERLWTRPTLEINGISGGGSYTVIPHRAAAHVTCRLVPGQDPSQVAAAIERHVAAQRVPGVRVQVLIEPGGVPAYTIDREHPAIRAARQALADVYPGQDVLLARIAGTLPATVLFEETLGAKTLFFSFSTADELLHAPNEFLRIPRLREGMRAWEQLFRLLADGEHKLEAISR
jgi:acetylornithine deacetylase/succinyl-diaminopimelate desuccinylase-like protein